MPAIFGNLIMGGGRIRQLQAAVNPDEPLRKAEAGGLLGIRNAISTIQGTSELDVGRTASFLRIDTATPCRVRIYTTNSARGADASRPAGTLPAQGSGCLFEFISVPILMGADLTPTVIVYNGDAVPIPQVYVNVEPTAPATTANVSFEYIILEA